MRNICNNHFWPLIIYIIFCIIIDFLLWLVIYKREGKCIANLFMIGNSIALLIFSLCLIFGTALLNLVPGTFFCNLKFGTLILLIIVSILIITDTINFFRYLFNSKMSLINYNPDCPNYFIICGKKISYGCD